MTTKRPTDIIRQQREDIDQTLREFHAAADGIKYRRDLSDEGKHDARRALRDQYLANLTSDAAAGWKLAQAALSSAKADYRAAHAEALDAEHFIIGTGYHLDDDHNQV
jgi:hypothetical protein